MKTTNLLRIAFLVVVIQYIAHGFFFLNAKPLHGQEEIALIESMKSHQWAFSGFTRSYWNFYFGYGLLAILWGAIEAILIWQLSTLSKISSLRIRPMIAVLFFANIVHAMIILNYFFLLPAIFDSIVSIFLAWSFFKAK